MPTKIIQLILSIVLVLAITTPSIVQLIDKNCELAMIFEVGDDDTEKEEKESKEVLEIKYFVSDEDLNSKSLFVMKCQSDFHLNTFKELHSENISPPPEHI
jgi:hypothetical protein